jgi:hypothetical protein
MPRKKQRICTDDEQLYEVTVWDVVDGDIVTKLWEATAADLDYIEQLYGDEPWRYTIVAEPK